MFNTFSRVKIPFELKELERNSFGMVSNNNPIYPTPPQKLHFRIGYFYSFGALQSNSSQSSNLPPRISSEQLFFARLARPIQQIFILHSISRDRTSQLHRKKKLKLGRTQMTTDNISPRNWFVKFKAITPVVNSHQLFLLSFCFLNIRILEWNFFQHCIITGKTSSAVGAKTWKLGQVENNHFNDSR